ncbi:MAG: ABC transporter ATP-binding protein [Erysipelotrichaceae bacterium]
MAKHGPQNVRKPLNPFKTLKRLLAFIKDSLPALIFVFIVIGITSLLSVYATHLVNPLFESISMMLQDFDTAYKAFVKVLAMLGIVYFLTALLQFISDRITTTIVNRTLNKIRNQMFSKMQRLPLSFFDSKTHGELMSYYTNDVGAIRDALGNSLVSLVSALVTLISTFVMMLTISPLLTLVIIVLIIVMTFITKFIGSKSIRNYQGQQSAIAKLNGYMEEMMGGQKVVKVFNHQDAVKEQFDQINQQARKNSTKANFYAGVMGPISNNLSHINFACCSVIGAYLVIAGTITVADLIEFLQHSKNFANPLSRIMQQFNSITSAIAGAERIFSILDQPEEIDDGSVTLVYATFDINNQLIESEERTGLWAWKVVDDDGSTHLVRLRGDVVFKDVDFSYDGKKQVLDDVSFYAKPGQKIAFVGATGAGKTTITNLITRFYEISEGTILYDGIDIKKIKKSSLRQSMAMVLQDTHLFTGTVKDNVRYGKLDATDEEIVEACKLANADEFINRLPQGYDTVLKGDGSNLSQGQRQLLSIARAAIADAPVLILDEATSSIDTRTEKLIEEGMDNLMAGRTVFVIAHRLSTVRNSNAIMVLENGRIIERGDHDDLIEQKGKYYSLYTGQFELD